MATERKQSPQTLRDAALYGYNVVPGSYSSADPLWVMRMPNVPDIGYRPPAPISPQEQAFAEYLIRLAMQGGGVRGAGGGVRGAGGDTAAAAQAQQKPAAPSMAQAHPSSQAAPPMTPAHPQTRQGASPFVQDGGWLPSFPLFNQLLRFALPNMTAIPPDVSEPIAGEFTAATPVLPTASELGQLMNTTTPERTFIGGGSLPIGENIAAQLASMSPISQMPVQPVVDPVQQFNDIIRMLYFPHLQQSANIPTAPINTVPRALPSYLATPPFPIP